MRLFTNNAQSTLAADITAVATALSVAAGDGALFPNPAAPDDFMATIYTVDASNNITAKEIVQVTARATDSFSTIVRAQEGTTAQAWTAATAKVALFLTAGDIDKYLKKVARGMHTGTNWYSPLADYSGGPLTISRTLSTLYYEPFIVETPISLDRIAVEVTTAGVSICRLGICVADSNWVPGALTVDAGTIDAGTTGNKEIVIAVTLQPGRYFKLLNVGAAAVTFRVYGMISRTGFYGVTDATGNLANTIYSLTVARVQSAFPDPLPAATINTAGSASVNAVFARVSAV